MKKRDVENYLEMSKPFESSQEANESLEKFGEELGELRKKYRIQNLLVVVNGLTKYESGSVGEFITQVGYGDELKMEVLAAFALGHAKAEHQELINTVLGHAREKKYEAKPMKS